MKEVVDSILSALLCWIALPILFCIALARGIKRVFCALFGVFAETALAWAGFIDNEEQQLRARHE